MRTTELFITVIAFLTSLYSGYSQNIYFERITSEQGLSNNMVTDAKQDENGFLWFATNNGLNRYDGYEFKVFRNVENDSTSLRSNKLTSLHLDKKGYLWIASLDGLTRMDIKTHQSIKFIHESGNSKTISDNEVLSICEDSTGCLWVGTNKGGLNKINQNTLEVSRINVGFERIPSLFFDIDGKLWIGTAQNCILKYDIEHASWKIYENSLSKLELASENDIWFIQRDNGNKLIFGMTSGIYSYDEKNEKIAKYLSNIGTLGSYRNNEIRYLYEDSFNKIWIGTWGKGIYIHDPQTGNTSNYRIEPNNPNSLSNNDVNFIFKDRSGVTWIGTQDGLNKLDPALMQFKHVQNSPNNSLSLNFNYVSAFEDAGKDQLWIGTFGGGINLFDRATGKFISFLHNSEKKNSLINDAVRVIRKDSEGMIWIGTMDGLDMYNPVEKKFKHFKNNPKNLNSITGNNIMAVYEDRRKNLWIGSYGNGLCAFNVDRSEITNWNGKGNGNNRFKGDFVRAIYEDSFGYIWIGLVENGGLYQYNQYTNEFRHFTHQNGDSTTISHNNINSIYQDESGRLWVGTWAGLDLFDYNSGEFSHITKNDGLPDSRIVEIISDFQGNLWLSTQMGLSRLQFLGNGLNIVNYSISHGIQGNEFNVNAKFRSKSGELYFGGTNGFNHFDPSEIHINNYAPPVLVTDFQIFNKSQFPGIPFDGRIVLNKDISVTDTIFLRYSDKVISFGFSALSFSNQKNNKFKYMMEGIDKGWVETNAERRFASYTNLEPGEYKFHVKASNNDRLWNEHGKTLNIIVAPPFWKTWWAYIAYFIILIMMIIGIRRIILIRLRLKNDVLIERIEKAKIEEINQMKLRFFMNISHEFKTPLTLILGPLEELLSDLKIDKDIFRNQLLLMHKNANRLLRLINQLMDFRKIEQSMMEISVSNGDIVSFIKYIHGAFVEFSEKHNINFTFESTKEKYLAWFDADKLEKILYNLISNAIKFTPDGGNVSVCISFSKTGTIQSTTDTNEIKNASNKIKTSDDTSDDFITISVKDSGIGIPADRLQYIFNRFYQIKDSGSLKRKLENEGSGIGLSLTKSLVTSCKGVIEVSSIQGQGSEFVVTLPIKSNYFPEESLTDEVVDVSKMHYEPSKYLMETEYLNESNRNSLLEENGFDENTPVILIVEDNKELRTFIRYKFEPAYRILEADNGESGYQIALEFIPDLIISDIMMPGISGIELCQKLKTDFKTSHIPIILLTAKDSVESTLEGYETGADDYIPKPFNTRLLAVRIRNLIETRHKLRENIRIQILLEPQEQKNYSTDEMFLEKAVKMVENNLSNSEYNVDDFGSDLNMSRMQLYRKLKALTSLSANEFIRTIRLKKAAQILRSSSLNVSEVTYEVGFSDPKYFSKCFMKQYGITPSKYAEQK